MESKKIRIGISCIGSGVGQSVINSLRLSRLPFTTIGFGNNPYAYGAYDCEVMDFTPSIYDDNYIDDLISKCRQHRVDLVIPGMDDEVLLYAAHQEEFDAAGIKTLISDFDLVAICRDKERMSRELNQVVSVFVRNFAKQTLEAEIADGAIAYPLIAKPRGGFASRGIEIIRNAEDLRCVGDDHIIQELAIPQEDDPNYEFYMRQIAKGINPQVSEVSIQLVYSSEGQLLGRMLSYNKLNNGVPIEIVPFESEYIWGIIDQLTPTLLKLGLKGPLNIQGRLTKKGFKMFEMNPRFTGITGLRALMGFNEVEACVKEWLGIDKGRNQLALNPNRFGIRQTADKSIPLDRNQDAVHIVRHLHGGKTEVKRNLLVTGACGYLGQSLMGRLIHEDGFAIQAFDLNRGTTERLYAGLVAKIFDQDDVQKGRISLGNVDVLVHLGFSRPHGTNQQIAESLAFTSELFTRALLNHVPAVLNISSQSVYGLENAPPWTETTAVAPQSNYAQAKYATELFLENAHRTLKTLAYSSIRLASLAGGASGLVEVDLLSKLCRQALAGQPIHLIGGMQQLERLDIRDAVEALISMLKINPLKWKPVYNLGSGQYLDLKKIAEIVVAVASEYNGGRHSEILVEKRDVNMRFGMDSSLFRHDFQWARHYDIEDTIRSLMAHFTETERRLL